VAEKIRKHPASDVCIVCGRGPARLIAARRQIGLVVFNGFRSFKAPLCREHGLAVVTEYFRRTVIEGWWSIFGFLNWVAVVSDLITLRSLRRAPEPQGMPAAPEVALPDDVLPVVGDNAQENAARRSVLVTVFAAIGLGVLVLIVTIAVLANAGENETDDIGRVMTFANGLVLTLYGAVGLLVSRQLERRTVTPRIVVGSRVRAIATSAIWGLGAAAIAVGFNSLIEGRLSSDPSIGSAIYERAWLATAVLVIALVIAAPFIEEMLFRGLFVESLRSKGQMTAVLSGAVAFSFWHLNPFALRYYVLAGFLLGYLYWRYGLVGSITAHALFNTSLGVAAVVALLLGPVNVEDGGVRLELPAGWHLIDEESVDEEFAGSDETGSVVVLAAETISGAGFALEFVRLEQGSPSGFDRFAVPPAARNVREIPAAEGVGTRFALSEPDGTELDVVVMRRANAFWVTTLTTNASDRAIEQYPEILISLQLPEEPVLRDEPLEGS
jgi:membrane protease YdiL (CAAX protease family)